MFCLFIIPVRVPTGWGTTSVPFQAQSSGFRPSRFFSWLVKMYFQNNSWNKITTATKIRCKQQYAGFRFRCHSYLPLRLDRNLLKSNFSTELAKTLYGIFIIYIIISFLLPPPTRAIGISLKTSKNFDCYFITFLSVNKAVGATRWGNDDVPQ